MQDSLSFPTRYNEKNQEPLTKKVLSSNDLRNPLHCAQNRRFLDGFTRASKIFGFENPHEKFLNGRYSLPLIDGLGYKEYR